MSFSEGNADMLTELCGYVPPSFAFPNPPGPLRAGCGNPASLSQPCPSQGTPHAYSATAVGLYDHDVASLLASFDEDPSPYCTGNTTFSSVPNTLFPPSQAQPAFPDQALENFLAWSEVLELPSTQPSSSSSNNNNNKNNSNNSADINWTHMLTLEPVWVEHITEVLSAAVGQQLSPVPEPTSVMSHQTDQEVAVLLKHTWSELDSKPLQLCCTSPIHAVGTCEGLRLIGVRSAHQDLVQLLGSHEQHCWQQMQDSDQDATLQVEMLGAVMNVAPLRSFLDRMTAQAITAAKATHHHHHHQQQQQQPLQTPFHPLLKNQTSVKTSPDSSSPKKKAPGFPKEIINLLNQWYEEHKGKPYFKGREKDELVAACSIYAPITRDQVAKWMINKRHRTNLKCKKAESRANGSKCKGKGKKAAKDSMSGADLMKMLFDYR